MPLRGQEVIPPQATSQAPLVIRGVTVIDVEAGQRVPDQTVVVVGNRIQAVGAAAGVTIPREARVVDGQGKYLIPGLWDMHTHAGGSAGIFYPLFLANGITGIRDAGSPEPLDTLRRWRREILAGTRLGPPRQILSGQSVGELSQEVWATIFGQPAPDCRRSEQRSFQACVTDTADARRYVDSVRAAGADMIKARVVSRGIYFAVAAEARRLGVPFGGHIHDVTAQEAVDSGARLVDHLYPGFQVAVGGPVWASAEIDSTRDLNFRCWSAEASLARCRPLAELFRKHGAWWVPTLTEADGGNEVGYALVERLHERVGAYWADSSRNPFVTPGSSATIFADLLVPGDSSGALGIARRAGLPILAGTDEMGADQIGAPWPTTRTPSPGFSLHTELAIDVADGLTPLEALRTATLNPAQMWHATDSLGTVAKGKLADLVLLDGDPLADIANTTAIRAVIANGRYFDRAALDRLLAQVQTDAQAQIRAPAPTPAGP